MGGTTDAGGFGVKGNMVRAEGTTGLASIDGSGLPERLFSRGWEFDFFQAVWLLERYSEGWVRVGERGPVGRELFRFRPDASMGFPATDVRRVTRMVDTAGNVAYYRLDVTFMGLYGVSTPLPLHYAVEVLRSTEAASEPEAAAGPVRQRSSAGAPTDEQAAPPTPVRDFLDIFHHRLISLFYRSWLKYRYDKAFGIPGRDVITHYLLWLIGLPRAYGEAVLEVPPIRLLRYAGILTQRPRSAATLEGFLLDYWRDVGVGTEQCVGRWVPVRIADRNCIGVLNSHLGVNITIGEQIYDLSGAFKVVVGPTDWGTYLSFLPGAERYNETRALVRLYCVDPLSFGVEVRLNAGEVPELGLCSDERAGRLGFTSWARTGPMLETSVAFAVC